MSASRLEREDRETAYPILVSTWLSPSSYIYFRSETLSCLPLVFRPLGTGRLWCIQGMARCLPSTHLPLPHLPHFPDPPCLSGWSHVSWCCAECNGSRVASLLSSTSTSLFFSWTTTFDSDASSGIDRVSILHFTACVVTSTRLTCVMHNAPHNTYVQALAVRCAVLSPLHTHGLQCVSRSPHCNICPRCRGGYGRHLLQSLSHQALLIKVAHLITTITCHRLSIIWHQQSVASHSNMQWNVFGKSNSCDSNAIGHWLTI